MINRRRFLAGTAATAASAFLPEYPQVLKDIAANQILAIKES
jgi:hypothetical protein